MAKLTSVLVLHLLLLTATVAVAKVDPAPGAIKLLPGYRHKIGMGMDSKVGTIWKKGGLTIAYDIGVNAGNYTECDSCGWTKGELWRKKQIINGQEAVFVFTKSRRLVVSLLESRANFFAIIRTESDMADMLLMVSTFQQAKQ